MGLVASPGRHAHFYNGWPPVDEDSAVLLRSVGAPKCRTGDAVFRRQLRQRALLGEWLSALDARNNGSGDGCKINASGRHFAASNVPNIAGYFGSLAWRAWRQMSPPGAIPGSRASGFLGSAPPNRRA